MEQLLCLKNGAGRGVAAYLEQSSGKVYADNEGRRLLRVMEPCEFVLGDKGQAILDEHGHKISVSTLANVASEHMARRAMQSTFEKTRYECRDESGKLVLMDLAPSDVHTNAALANYAAGYRIADGIADAASPAILVPKQSDVYYTWNSDNDFKRKVPNEAAPGSAVSEVNPTLAASTYTALQYALAGFLPTEIQANADAPLRPFVKLTQMIVDGLRLEREYRVASGLQTSGNWNSNLVQTVASGAQWDGGAAADPVAVIHHAIEQSFLPVTALAWSELVLHDFLRNPAVQKYFFAKDMVNGLPKTDKLSEVLDLPPIITGRMKYVTGGNLTYVWGNHVVLLHQPAQMPPTDQMDVATALTFRWNGGEAPDGTLTGGFLVRSYYDPKRGARGGTQLVVTHSDIELQTSGLVGGLILNAHQ